MAKKSFLDKLTGIAKWVVVLFCALLGLKLLIGVATFLSASIAIATVGAWLLGLAVVGGGLLFVGAKLLKKKK